MKFKIILLLSFVCYTIPVMAQLSTIWETIIGTLQSDAILEAHPNIDGNYMIAISTNGGYSGYKRTQKIAEKE